MGIKAHKPADMYQEGGARPIVPEKPKDENEKPDDGWPKLTQEQLTNGG